MRSIIVALSCLCIAVTLSGCLEQSITVEANAHRGDPTDTGLLPAFFQFNITNLVHQEIKDVDMEIVFFKINEHELSKYLVNTRFIGDTGNLPPGETKTFSLETYVDPLLSPLNISGIWGSDVHWQMTFKISWEATKIHITTQTFNWDFP